MSSNAPTSSTRSSVPPPGPPAVESTAVSGAASAKPAKAPRAKSAKAPAKNGKTHAKGKKAVDVVGHSGLDDAQPAEGKLDVAFELGAGAVLLPEVEELR